MVSSIQGVRVNLKSYVDGGGLGEEGGDLVEKLLNISLCLSVPQEAEKVKHVLSAANCLYNGLVAVGDCKGDGEKGNHRAPHKLLRMGGEGPCNVPNCNQQNRKTKLSVFLVVRVRPATSLVSDGFPTLACNFAEMRRTGISGV